MRCEKSQNEQIVALCEKVLILVLVEYALRELANLAGHSFSTKVLILVLVEYALRGDCGLSYAYPGQVLILVLVEYALRVRI